MTRHKLQSDVTVIRCNHPVNDAPTLGNRKIYVRQDESLRVKLRAMHQKPWSHFS